MFALLFPSPHGLLGIQGGRRRRGRTPKRVAILLAALLSCVDAPVFVLLPSPLPSISRRVKEHYGFRTEEVQLLIFTFMLVQILGNHLEPLISSLSVLVPQEERKEHRRLVSAFCHPCLSAISRNLKCSSVRFVLGLSVLRA